MNIKKIISAVGIGAGAIIVGLGIQYALAAGSTWSPAHQTPSNCDPALDSGCNPPINVGSSIQTKLGSLILNAATPIQNAIGLTVFGTSTFNGTVQIVDGTQGPNKVLTSDANGNASWQTGGNTSPTIVGGYEMYTYDGSISGAPTAGTRAGCRYVWGAGTCTSYSSATCPSGTSDVHQSQGEDMLSSGEGTASQNGFSFVNGSSLQAGYYDVGVHVCTK